MKQALLFLGLLLAACGGRAETNAQDDAATADAAPLTNALEGCGAPIPQAVPVWCDRDHTLAVYCSHSPSTSGCVVAKVADDGTGDALYCCNLAEIGAR